MRRFTLSAKLCASMRSLLGPAASGHFRVLVVSLWLLPAVGLAGADYTPDELLAKSRAAHAQPGRFSMQVWTRSFDWSEGVLTRTNSSTSRIVRGDGGWIALVGVRRYSYLDADNQQKGQDRIERQSFRIESGPRFLRGEWSSEKGKVIDRPVTVDTYKKEIRRQLSEAFAYYHPFDTVMFGPGLNYESLFDQRNDTMRIAGRENIAGHNCIRLDTSKATIWFDADTLLIRRFMAQSVLPTLKSGRVVDVYCDTRSLPADEPADLAPVLDDTFEGKAMQWVPFLPLEQLRDNIRITGRAAGLLIAAPEDQPQAQPALPPLTPEQRASIVTIEGDVLSGLGFYSRHKENDFLITDVRFVTQNRWIKVRDWQGNSITFAGVFQAEGSRVALLKATSVPGRLAPSIPSRRKNDAAALFMICAFDKANDTLLPVFCVSRASAAGDYRISHALSDHVSGGPILNLDDGSVGGVLIKSDPPKNKPPGPVIPQWHAEPLFSHNKWIQIGSIPVK